MSTVLGVMVIKVALLAVQADVLRAPLQRHGRIACSAIGRVTLAGSIILPPNIAALGFIYNKVDEFLGTNKSPRLILEGTNDIVVCGSVPRGR